MTDFPRDTGAAQLPALPRIRTGNVELDRWVQAVTERLEVREGTRGNPAEAVVTQRDLSGQSGTNTVIVVKTQATDAKANKVVVTNSAGAAVVMSVDAFAQEIFNTKLFQDLMTWITPLKPLAEDPGRFDDLPAPIRNAIVVSVADEAAKRGTDITEVQIIQNKGAAQYALDQKIVTAAIGNDTASGFRGTLWAYVDGTKEAAAGQVEQLEARLKVQPGNVFATAAIETIQEVDVTREAAKALQKQRIEAIFGTTYAAYDDAIIALATAEKASTDKTTKLQSSLGRYYPDGTAGTSLLEVTMKTSADRIDGLYSRYMVKVQAGGALGGFGIEAYEGMNLDGTAGKPETAFIVAADKFAIVRSDRALTDEQRLLPPPEMQVFGVDTNTNEIFINGHVKVKGSISIANTGVGALNSDGSDGMRPAAAYRNPLSASVQLGSAPAGGFDTTVARNAIYVAAASTTDAAFVAAVTEYANAHPGSAQTDVFLRIGDNVTEFWDKPDGKRAAATRHWNGNAWFNPGLIVNGDAIVNGTVAAEKINTYGLTILDNNNRPVFISGQSTAIPAGFVSGLGAWATSASQTDARNALGLGAIAAVKSIGDLAALNLFDGTLALKTETDLATASHAFVNAKLGIGTDGKIPAAYVGFSSADKSATGFGTTYMYGVDAAGNPIQITVSNFLGTLSKLSSANISNYFQTSAITKAYIGNAAIGSAQIENAAIDYAKISQAAIDQLNVNALTVMAANIQYASINWAQITNAQIDSAQIKALSVTNLKIGPDAVDVFKLANNSVSSGSTRTTSGYLPSVNVTITNQSGGRIFASGIVHVGGNSNNGGAIALAISISGVGNGGNIAQGLVDGFSMTVPVAWGETVYGPGTYTVSIMQVGTSVGDLRFCTIYAVALQK